MKIIPKAFKFVFFVVIIYLFLFYSIENISKFFEQEEYENILNAKNQPENGENVFFIESGESLSDVTLNTRQACSIESAALSNPYLRIFLIYSSRRRLAKLKMTSQIEALLSYPNIFINYLDLEQISVGSPFEKFVRSRKLLKSDFRIQHTSVLRLILLWKYGGTYLDTDMIVKRNLDAKNSNYACAQDEDYVNGAILNLDKFATNGPQLITDVLAQLCKTDNITQMVELENCEGFHVLKSDYCYPIPYNSWEYLMNEEYVDFVMDSINNSLVVHFWNYMSADTKINKNSNAPYIQLAREFCPNVFKQSKNVF